MSFGSDLCGRVEEVQDHVQDIVEPEALAGDRRTHPKTHRALLPIT